MSSLVREEEDFATPILGVDDMPPTKRGDSLVRDAKSDVALSDEEKSQVGILNKSIKHDWPDHSKT